MSSSTNSLSGGKENNNLSTRGSADASSTDENGDGSSSPSSSGDEDSNGLSSSSSSGDEDGDGSSSSSSSGDEDGDAPPFTSSLSSPKHDHSTNDNNTTPSPPVAAIHEESMEGTSNTTASRPDMLELSQCIQNWLNLIYRESRLLLENMASSAPHHLILYPRGIDSVVYTPGCETPAGGGDPQPSPRRVQKCSICGQPRKNHICTVPNSVPTIHTRDIGTNTDPCKDEGDKISLSSGISIVPVSFDNRHART